MGKDKRADPLTFWDGVWIGGAASLFITGFIVLLFGWLLSKNE